MALECEGHKQEGDTSPHSEVLNDRKIVPMANTPLRYLSLCHLYSATSPHAVVSRSSNIMSKKVKAKKTSPIDHLRISNETIQPESSPIKSTLLRVYSRRKKIHRQSLGKPVLAALEPSIEINCHSGDIDCGDDSGSGLDNAKGRQPRKRTVRSSELAMLSAESGAFAATLDGPRLRANRNHVGDGFKAKRPRLFDSNFQSDNKRRWMELSFGGVDSKRLIGLKCKVYWPLDDRWYCGRILAYDINTKKHEVVYDDGDKENLILKDEKVKFFASGQEIQELNLKIVSDCTEGIMVDCNELAALAAILDNCEEIDRGDVVWAKISGYAMWPAIVLDEPIVNDDEACKSTRDCCIPVQFFGTHDFARVNSKQVVSFLKGLISSFHLKCKKSYFLQGLKEVKRYLSERKLPEKMLLLQTDTNVDDYANTTSDDAEEADSYGSGQKDHLIPGEFQGNRFVPFQIGDIEVISLGNCVKDPQHFRDGAFIWPEGYTATRKFLSVEDPNKTSMYRMEVLKNSDSGAPLFRVTSDSGQQFEGRSPSACWNKIYRAIRRLGDSYIAGREGVEEHLHASDGLDMFGLSNHEILVLIQDSSNVEAKSILSDRKVVSEKVRDMSTGYRPVHLELNDLDKCNVCHMDEEYLNNLFLQCDRCRIMVHSRCYGESEPPDGLWLCNLCRSETSPSPICCLCPVIGGAMKPTTDGHWAHLTCAIWIPETCFYDIKKMEPIDGISRISKDRWKLLCSLCGVAYGACIQCSNNTCYVAYHPLCARAAGLCVEMIDEDRLHLVSADDEIDNLDECISLVSFCKKHKQPTIKPPASDIEFHATAINCSKYTPPCNPSGCARSEPYNYFGRRGRKEPEALAAASMKRAFVENKPYLVGGNFHQVPTIVSPKSERLNVVEHDACKNILSSVEKYIEMKNTFRKRLAFGKSGIHGFGIFAKMSHRGGDMVIEYAGELVRPSIADRRERLIYNSLVGAGTYMFRIDDERVIDATRAGSIAHLINHSCEPNCYSRAVTFNGDDHIIIFAKRDIEQWEELTYDYRFYSTDEHLPCYCGFPRCRGVVNDIEAESLLAKFYVPRTALRYGYP